MNATHWALVFGVLFAIGILAKLCMHVIKNNFARGVIVIIALGALAITEHAIFDLAMPGRQRGNDQADLRVYWRGLLQSGLSRLSTTLAIKFSVDIYVLTLHWQEPQSMTR